MDGVYGSSSNSHTRRLINDVVERVSQRTQLSTTGYQTAMGRLNQAHKSDDESLMTLRRAQQYTDAAKRAFSSETLKKLADLQQNRIYRTSSGNLRGGIEMTPEQLTDCVRKCREDGFSNCDIQALEIALHLRHRLGISDFTIYSNHRLSHNYVVIHPNGEFPKGALVDSWTGHGVRDLDLKTKLKFQHRDGNYAVNHHMHAWIERYGASHVID